MAVIKEDNTDASSNSSTQYTISLGDVFQGTLDPVRDRDWIRVELTSGTVYAISPDGLGQWLRYQVFDSQGQQVQRLPNPFPSFAIPPPGSKFIFDPPVSGTYYIQVYAFRPDENDGNPINYEVSVDENTIPVGTYDDLADYLTDGFWGGRRRAYDVTSGGELTANITGLTEKGQQLARWALEAWSNVTGIKFEFVDDDSAHISFDDNRPGGNAVSSVIDGVIASSHVNVDVRWITNNLALGSYNAFLHEIGHALGLGHPGPYPTDNLFGYGLSNIFLIDSDQATLMSYFTNQENTYIYANKAIYVTPMIADIIAIQNLYGVPNDINAGDTIYGYHSNVGGFLEQFFAQWTGENNPFFNISLDRNSRIDFVDLDDDSDPDLVVISGRFRYFENIGTVVNPDFIERTGTDNPFSNISGYRGSLTFADLNGDGDADFIVGGGNLRYFENMGTVANPEFMQRTGATNPLDAIESENGSMPLLVDLDSDSDIDLIVGYEDGTFDYFENTGIPTSPEFTQRTGLENPFNGIAIGNGSFPTIVDFDDDNDSDLVVLVPVGGNIYRYFENTGTVFSPSFTERTGTDNPFEKIFDSPYGAPSFVDIHGDGDLDHVVTSSIGHIIYIENIGTSTNSDFAIRSLRHNFVGLTLYDNGGIDTLDLSTDTDDQVIDLHQEGISNVYGLIGNLVIARDTVIENYIAGSGNDVITGNEADNILEGRAGADTLNGGGGSDTATYIGSAAAVTVNLTDGTATGGDAQGDTFSSIENLSGSAHDDSLTGDADNNVLEGRDGADSLDGGDGTDTASYAASDATVTVDLLNGTATGGHAAGDTITNIENLSGSRHNDTLTGDAGANRLEGSSGNDRLTGGAGADVLVGGPGSDAAYYANSASAVTVNLLDGTATGGDAQGDTIDSIENLTGSAHADTLIGDAGNNVLEGGDGADTLDGGDGIDTASYAGSASRVDVRLSGTVVNYGDATGDTLTNIENLIGSAHNDILVGNGQANTLTGNGGNDLLWASSGDDLLTGGPGADRLVGGAGNDTASFAGSPEGVTVRLHSLSAADGDAQGDSFPYTVNVAYTDAGGAEQTESLPDVENLIGSAHDDILAGDRRDNDLDGGAGNDTLYGGPGGGDDVMNGGLGNDRIFGGQGDDTLDGGPGDDRLAGGPGADVFVFGPGDGADTVTDFSSGTDRIDLTEFEIESVDDVTMTTGDDGVTVDLTDIDGGTVLLADLTTLPDTGDFVV